MRCLQLSLTGCIVALSVLILKAHASDIPWAKQLTPDIGWMATSHDLFWTTDAGRSWETITPPRRADEISAVFFLDNSNGWVVMASSYKKDATEEGAYDTITRRFFIASTNDAGANWSFQRVSTPQIDHSGMEGGAGLSDNAQIQFIDAQHGILNVEYATGSGFPRFAASVATSDGGRTWRDLGGNPPGGPLLFTSQDDGWIAGEEGLFVTHDGGKNWQEPTLPALVKREEARPIFQLPTFPDGKHGFLLVEYSGSGIQLAGLFSSLDGGRTWKLDKVVPVSSKRPLFTVVNSEWRTLSFADHKLTFASLSASSVPLSASIDASLAYPYTVSLLDSLHGWALVGGSYGPAQLLSTSDSGASWSIITPPPIKGNVVGHAVHVTGPGIWKKPSDISKRSSTPGSLQAAPDVSMHLGFDISYVMDIPLMQAWWDTSRKQGNRSKTERRVGYCDSNTGMGDMAHLVWGSAVHCL